MFNKRTMSSPEKEANILSRSVLWWLNGLLKIGSSRPIEKNDFYKLLPERRAQNLAESFDPHWQAEYESSSPSILRAIWNTHKWKILWVICCEWFLALVIMLLMSVLGLLIDWFTDQSVLNIFNDKRDGFILAGMMAFILLVNDFTMLHCGLQRDLLGYRIRTQCTTILYKKIIRLNSASGQVASVGKGNFQNNLSL